MINFINRKLSYMQPKHPCVLAVIIVMYTGETLCRGQGTTNRSERCGFEGIKIRLSLPTEPSRHPPPGLSKRN